MSKQDKRTQNRRKLQSLLRELFQFDHADLDFGIYRIMNLKRQDVERFIEKDLLGAVEEGLAQFQVAGRDSLRQAVEEKRRAVIEALGGDVIDASGNVVKYHDAPVVHQYRQALASSERAEVAAETEVHVFNDLWRFFSRYYDKGDFLTERRYSSREHKFYVPYNGEEVLLHWANRDQYYVKTGEYFTDYCFNTGDCTVWFRLQRAEVPQDNVKGDKRYFVLRDDAPLEYAAEAKTLTAFFEYRPLTEGEEQRLLAVYNAQQTKSRKRKTLDRSALCAALETEILDGLDDVSLKAQLARPRGESEGSGGTLLGYHLNQYTARNTMDYFIHKDLGRFLRRELDFFLKSEVLRLDDVIEDTSGESLQHVLARMRVVRQIADKVITFLAQIEDFQKRLFEKKKFVVQTDYCLTLDRVPEAFYPEILANEAQLEEWRRLYRIDAWEKDLFWQGDFDLAFLGAHPHLMLDTAFCDQDFKARLLATFEDLDEATDGLLIHGENFQGLNLLLAKYRERVKCIYIDPPYNTGNDDFLYKDNYQHSSWLSMMEERLELARKLMGADGAIFVSNDDNEQANLREACEGVFGADNFLNNVIWQKKYTRANDARWFSDNHDFLVVFANHKDSFRPALLPRTDKQIAAYSNPDNDPRGRWKATPLHAKSGRAGIFVHQFRNGVTWSPPPGTYPRYSAETLGKLDEENRIWFGSDGESVPARKTFLSEAREGVVAVTIWPHSEVGHNHEATDELKILFPANPYANPKPTRLLRRIVHLSCADIVLDFFAGSGTTAHAVMNLNREDGGNRKYILVEMADYFDTVLKPRIQKVAFSANWKDGVPQDLDGQSHTFKYQCIESYEDALNNIRVRQPEGSQRQLLYEEFDDYVLGYMLDFETRDSPALLTQEAFEMPFDYTLKVQRGHQSPQDTVVDLVETFHYLIGMHVRRLERHEHQGRPYVVCRGVVRTEKGVEKVVIIWRDTEGLDLEQEAGWANEELLTETVDRVYVNGPSFIKKAEPLEITFRDRMGGARHGA